MNGYLQPRPDPAPGEPAQAGPLVDPSLVSLTHIIYGLHSVSLAIGVFGSMFIVAGFLFSIPSIIAVILNYAKRSDVRGTYLESHFRWQIRTFWFAVLWAGIAFLVWAVFAIVLIGWVLGPLLLIVTGLWVVYRVIRGWLALVERRPVPA